MGQQKVSQDRGVPGQVTGVLGHVTGDTFGLSQDTLSWDIYPTVPGHLTYELFEKSSEVCGRGLPKGIDASDSDGAIRFLAKRCLC